MAEEKPASPVRDIRKELILILEGVVSQLMTIPFPPVNDSKREKPDAYIQMHWCPEHGYHRVKEP